MINLDLIDRALNTLDVYFQRAFHAELLCRFNPVSGTNKAANRCRCVGIVLHDRILTERPGYENKSDKQPDKTEEGKQLS